MAIQRNGGGDSYAVDVSGSGDFVHAVSIVNSSGAAVLTVPVEGEVAADAVATSVNPVIIGGVQPSTGRAQQMTVDTISNQTEYGFNGSGRGTPTVSVPMLYQSASNWEIQRNNQAVTLLASAARVATTNSSDQTNYNARGVQIVLNATANPGGAETLTLSLQGKDSISGTYYEICTTGVALTAANGIRILHAYPGILSADYTGTTNIAKSVSLPRTWRAVVTHSASGSWTYSLSASVIL